MEAWRLEFGTKVGLFLDLGKLQPLDLRHKQMSHFHNDLAALRTLSLSLNSSASNSWSATFVIDTAVFFTITIQRP